MKKKDEYNKSVESTDSRMTNRKQVHSTWSFMNWTLLKLMIQFGSSMSQIPGIRLGVVCKWTWMGWRTFITTNDIPWIHWLLRVNHKFIPPSTFIRMTSLLLTQVEILFASYTSNISWIVFSREITDEDKEKEVKKIKESEADERTKRSITKKEIHDLHVNYLLRNDRFLLFNRGDFDVRSTKSRKPHSEEKKSIFNDKTNSQSELPAGLLYLRPLPVKVDRHLVKGAVRLLAIALKIVLNESNFDFENLNTRFISTSCWRPTRDAEKNISLHFGRWLPTRFIAIFGYCMVMFSQLLSVFRRRKSGGKA